VAVDALRAVPGTEGSGSEQAVPVLRLLSYGQAPEDHVLVVGKNAVGRHPDNDVVLSSRTVSRWHCAIVLDSNRRCVVEDVGSASGVVVNGKCVSGPVPLRYGDEIGVGNQRLVLLLVVNGLALAEVRE
jgi:pSer/pThr/pTyr-binding forkhead associated (FHA) protein